MAYLLTYLRFRTHYITTTDSVFSEIQLRLLTLQNFYSSLIKEPLCKAERLLAKLLITIIIILITVFYKTIHKNMFLSN